MSNSNSFSGFQNLPAQSITTTTDTPLLVPVQGLYSTLPSPNFVAGTGLYVGPSSDILGNATSDGRPFTIRVAGKAVVGAAGNFTVTFKLGNSATSANNTAITGAAAVAAISGASSINFWFEIECIWDSVSTSLTGYVSGVVGGTLKAPTVITPLTVALPSAALTPSFQFIPSFTFSVANAANSVTVTELAVDRGV